METSLLQKEIRRNIYHTWIVLVFDRVHYKEAEGPGDVGIIMLLVSADLRIIRERKRTETMSLILQYMK